MVVLHPKERRLCITGVHRGTRGTLDEFKAAWGGRIAHDGDLPKILGGESRASSGCKPADRPATVCPPWERLAGMQSRLPD